MCKCGRGDEYFSVRDGVKCVYLVCICVSVMFFYLSKTDLVMSTTKKCVQTITVSVSYW